MEKKLKEYLKLVKATPAEWFRGNYTNLDLLFYKTNEGAEMIYGKDSCCFIQLKNISRKSNAIEELKFRIENDTNK